MKKTRVVISLALAVLLLTGCNNLSSRGEELKENVMNYWNIAEYADANFRIDEYYVSSDRYAVVLSDISDIAAISSDVYVAMQDYSYFWIEDSGVLFWNDETKTEGILCPFDPDTAIKELKKWYEDVQIEKIHEGCYLITQSQAWIG